MFLLKYYLTDWSTLREKCPYLKLFSATFSRIRTEYKEIHTPHLSVSVRMRVNVDQNNSEYGYFLRSAMFVSWEVIIL